MDILSKNYIAIITVFIVSILLAACGSDHDHGPTPVGLEMLINGEAIASQEGTSVTYHGDNDYIEVNQGETYGPVTVQFITDTGEAYNYTTEDGYSLQYNITDENVLQINHPVNNNEWTIELVGNAEGSSSFNVELFHVDHVDFESQNFNIQVVSQ